VYTQHTCERNRRIHATHVYYIIPLNYWFRSFQPGPAGRMDGRPYYERERERWQKGRHVHTTLSPRWNVCVYRGRKTKKWRNERYTRKWRRKHLTRRRPRSPNPFNLLPIFFFLFFSLRHSTSGWLAIPDAIKKKVKSLYSCLFFFLNFTTNVGGVRPKIHHAVTISRIRTRTPDGRRTRAHTYYI
jgi:hypothetical protein